MKSNDARRIRPTQLPFTQVAAALLFACATGFVWMIALLSLHAADMSAGIRPQGLDGRVLNLDFEDGSLRDWTVEGKAFEGQPVQGDAVAARRPDMKSQHQGDYWIGGFERVGDDPRGTLTSAPFRVTHPWASFLVGGGPWPSTRVELVEAGTQKVLVKVSGLESENLRPAVVSMEPHLNKTVFIRLVDQQSGHWGHLNFDGFWFYRAKPSFSDAIDPARPENQPPPADVVPHAGLTAAEAVQAATLPEGFKLHAFAHEPDVRQPIAFCLDDRGRIWVAEGHTYPKRAPEGKGKDRILVFEDTNHDHKFDRRTVFMEGLNLISGLEIGFGGVWVGAAPHLLFIPVQDWNEPKPAGEPKVLLDGWDYLRDTHETLNTFIWGPDGWLYGCHGVFCPSHVGKPGAPESERQWVDAAVWRYHPIRQAFEVFAEGTSNPWGVDFDELGQCWIEACVIPHLWHMIQGGRYERQGGLHYTVGREETARHAAHREPNSRKPIYPYVFEDIKTVADHVHYAGNRGPHAANGRSDEMGGGHAHAGLMVYLGDSWPETYRGGLFMGNIHGQRLNVDKPERKGSGFVGKHSPDFLNFNDTWSQTLNQRYDHNGSVYIIDWYDKNQCHHNNEGGHDRSNGRIYKIVYRDQPHTSIDLRAMSNAQLVSLQLHKNDWHVRHARRILQERAAESGPNKEVREGLLAILRDHPSTSRKLRALWALNVSGNLDVRTAIENLKSPDEYVRAWTVQLAFEDLDRLRGWITEAETQGLRADPDLFQLAETDPSPVVRLYLAAAMQRAPFDMRGRMVASLLKRSEDAGDHNLPLMIWYAMEPLVPERPREALQAAFDTALPRILNFTSRRIVLTQDPASQSHLVEALASEGPEAKKLEVLQGIAAALQGRRNVTPPPGWSQAETRLASSPHAEVRALAQSLSLTFGSASALATLRATLLDRSAEAKARRSALDALATTRDPSLPTAYHTALTEPTLRGPAIRALGAYDHPDTPARLLEVYGQLNATEKRDALASLCSRVSYARPLLAAVQKAAVPKSDLTAEWIRQLRNLNHPEVQADLERVWGSFRESPAEKKQAIARFRSLYRAGGSQPGDGPRGRAVYNRVCAQCHTLFDQGANVGPNLTGSNRTDLDYLLENMVDPNAVIPHEYRSSTIETTDDRVITGLVKEQNDQVVVIATQTESLTLQRKDVKRISQSEISMMPEGLIDNLTEQEVRDLIYYLGRPGQVPLPKP
ncbi:MAG: c-type cytochrome [Verrucomicrobia bacterium]|nr:c-type cytochrome [Verrucomicrobiota bacterium]